MRMQLRPLSDQVIVITGASSGIGLTTARMAVERGAKVVMAARNEAALREAAERINREHSGRGGEAIAVITDVSSEQDVRQLGRAAGERFGRIDTWVNNAGVGLYGKVLETAPADGQQLFAINFWGVFYGCIVATEHLRESGGAIVNIGSMTSDRTVPLLGVYSASKHAVKSLTDALRMELEKDGVPISLSLIKPSGINTPFVDHAKSLLKDANPDYPPPVYAPETVARAILHCATHATRDLTVGSGGKMFTTMHKLSARMTDRVMRGITFRQQKTQHERDRRDALYAPSYGGEERGPYEGMVRERSYMTTAARHPLATTALVTLGALAAATAVMASKPRRSMLERIHS